MKEHLATVRAEETRFFVAKVGPETPEMQIKFTINTFSAQFAKVFEGFTLENMPSFCHWILSAP